MLKADDLNVYYGKIHAIKNVSFEVKNGEIVSLIGANGAGKTTILHTISGLLRSTTGSITFEDKNISHIEPHKLVRHGLSHVPEGRHVFLQMTVLENLEMGAYSMKKVSPSALKRVYELFPRLEERKNQIAGTLSGGEQQMLADQIFSIIKDLHYVGTTILLVEQNAGKALAISDRAYVLESGRIVLSGTGKELAESEEIKKAYLGG